MSKDFRLRERFLSLELRSKFLRCMATNTYLPICARLVAYDKLGKVGSVRRRIRNYCVFTGKGRSIVSGYNLSRSVFKLKVKKSEIFGVVK